MTYHSESLLSHDFQFSISWLQARCGPVNHLVPRLAGSYSVTFPQSPSVPIHRLPKSRTISQPDSSKTWPRKHIQPHNHLTAVKQDMVPNPPALKQLQSMQAPTALILIAAAVKQTCCEAPKLSLELPLSPPTLVPLRAHQHRIKPAPHRLSFFSGQFWATAPCAVLPGVTWAVLLPQSNS